MAIFLIVVGNIAFLIGLITLVRPIAAIKIPTRKIAGCVLAAGFAIGGLGGMLSGSDKSEKPGVEASAKPTNSAPPEDMSAYQFSFDRYIGGNCNSFKESLKSTNERVIRASNGNYDNLVNSQNAYNRARYALENCESEKKKRGLNFSISNPSADKEIRKVTITCQYFLQNGQVRGEAKSRISDKNEGMPVPPGERNHEIRVEPSYSGDEVNYDQTRCTLVKVDATERH